MVALVNKCDMSGSRQSGCGNQPSGPSGCVAVGRYADGVGVVAAAGQEPGDQGVGVPHLARVQLVAAPRGGRKGGSEVEQPPSPVDIGAHVLGAGDRFGDVGDDAVAPAADLVAEKP